LQKLHGGAMSTKARWIIFSGREVTVGDEVALEFHPDETDIITSR
jgi:hypothetical protein